MRLVMWMAVPAYLFAINTFALADDACSNALDCYSKALVKLQAAAESLSTARKEIESLNKNVSALLADVESLKQSRVDLETRIQSLPNHPAEEVVATPSGVGYPDPSSVGKKDRKNYVALHNNLGTTTAVPEADIIEYCSDKSGCELIVGMYNWDGLGRVASRSSRLFYNKDSKVWRAEFQDREGTKTNGASEPVVVAWACHFMDGQFDTFRDLGDHSGDFGLVAWNDNGPRSDCYLTIAK